MSSWTTLHYLLYNVMVICSRIPSIQAVKGCVTYVTGENYSMRQSICDKPDTHFQEIPPALPSQVIKLTVNHQEIRRLNASQFKHLPNLTYLDLDSNHLIVIDPDTFNRLPHLKTLSLRFNSLTLTPDSMHPAVFHGLGRLENLNLYHNPITNVPDRIFAPVGTSLQTLVLGGTTQGFSLNPASLDGLINLQSLDLSSNHLETLPETIERNFAQMKLKQLFLYDNPWKCDCHLRWLKLWFLRQAPDFVFYRSIPDGFNPDLMDASLNVWMDSTFLASDTTRNVLQPKCASPPSLKNRPLFDVPDSNDVKAVGSTEFSCPPRALTPDKPVYFTLMRNASVACEFFADPTGIVLWYKNGTQLHSSSDGRITIAQNQTGSLRSVLTIADVIWSDGGTYMCILDTGYGRVNSTFQVLINSRGTNSLFSGTVFRWTGGFNTSMVLKFLGIAASCLIVLIMVIGLLIYCFCGSRFCKRLETMKTNSNTKPIDTRKQQKCEKMNGSQSRRIDPANEVPACRRSQRSTLINRQMLTVSEPSTSDICMVTNAAGLDNYVAIRIVSPDNHTEFLPNYTFLQPVESNNLFVSDVNRIQPLLGRADVRSNFESLHALSPATVVCQPVDLMSEELHVNPSRGTTQEPQEPCPLHGTMYATLQSNRISKPSSNARKHLTTIPVGLESTADKRFSTLPSRGKRHSSGSGQTSASQQPSSKSISPTSFSACTPETCTNPSTNKLNGISA